MGRHDVGQSRLFADQTYHFQTLRALNDIAAYEADTSEILEAIKHIHAGDAQGWFRAWSQAGDWVAARARATADHIATDRALLRAHNYYRTAEFFLPPNDPNRPASAEKNMWWLYAGLDTLGVAYERIRAPYGTAHHLETVYYPAVCKDSDTPKFVLGCSVVDQVNRLFDLL